MNIVDLLQITKGGRSLLDHGDALGLSKGDMVGALGRLVPALAGAMQHQVASKGLDLGAVLAGLGGPALANAVDSDDAASLDGYRDQGQGVLNGLLGGQAGAETLSNRIAEAMGLDASAVQAFGPMAAGLFTGVLSKVDDGSFKPSGGGMSGMAATMAANMLMTSGAGAKGLLGFIDTDGARDLLAGLLD